MAVSLTDSPRLSLKAIKRLSATIGVVAGTAFYLYGPSVTPLMHASAVAACNEVAGGNYRSYQLDWVVDSRPHWSCGDRSKPTQPPVDLGWWVGLR